MEYEKNIEEIHKMAQIALGEQVDKDCTKWAIKEGFFDNFEALYDAGYRKESDTAQLAIQRFINQLHIDEIIRVDSDLGKELLKEKEFVLKRYYGVDLGE